MHKRSDKTLPFSIESQSDIQKLLSLQVKEDLHIAFKTWKDFDIHSPKKLEQLTLMVSSFANTVGGYIFFGIEAKRRKAIGIVHAAFSQESCDQLEYYLQSNICPAIEHLSVKRITIDGDESKALLVIQIPNSDLAPHMAQDKRFYQRADFKEVVMQEH